MLPQKRILHLGVTYTIPKLREKVNSLDYKKMLEINQLVKNKKLTKKQALLELEFSNTDFKKYKDEELLNYMK